ncbi:RNA methyltransferase [Ottowia thiooxydans]|uniref:RNA methyltransferase n=1 Tax=Ottowia thiooxydans TaxID=219182 RepID=UPI000400FABB|nr:RNA methyltransferase [Ottowia thiooxydans]
MQTRFVLIESSHAGNVGAVARAMKVMGFDDLVLVAPRWPDVLTRAETVERASGATDVLEKARVVSTVEEALSGCTHLCATAMTPRDFGPPTRSPRAHFQGLLAPERRIDEPPEGIAFLFGSERYGMKNEDVYRCHVALSIPTNPDYGSLNLAAAVQLIAYDWRQALFARFGDSWALPMGSAPKYADAAQIAGMLVHWETSLADIGFLDPAAPKKLMPRLTQLFNRAELTQEEIHILRGIAKAMSESAANAKRAKSAG